MSKLELRSFFPFRLNRLAAEVSSELAKVYSERFGIDIVEWRILVTLAAHQPCSAQLVVQSTRTHKSRISRGVTRLLEMKLISRTENPQDRRQANLRLSAKGKKLHVQLVPLVLDQEARMLACLSQSEQKALNSVLNKLEDSLGLMRDAG